MQGLASRIAEFTSKLDAESLPDDVVELARNCLLNAYGIALCGLDTPYARVAGVAAMAIDGLHADGATLLGDGRRTSAGGACLANAALFHGRAQEDTCGAAHFGTVLIPLVTAIVESRRLSVSAVMPALVAGYEAGGLIEQAGAHQTTPAGFRSTALYGTIAAAATAAHLLGLDAQQTAAALANAASFSGGVLQSFAEGSDEWRYQPGVVARNGWVAAELARAGSSSAALGFEGRSGLFAAFARCQVDVDGLAAKLGTEWAIRRVTFKPHPVCAFNQTPVTAALALREKVDAARIAAVKVRMNPYETNYAGMDGRGPFNSISGTLMSIPFCIATTLAHGAPSMARMTSYDDPEVEALQRRVEIVADEAVPRLSAVLEASLTTGEVILHRQTMSEIDYQFERPALMDMLERIAAEQQLDAGYVTRIDGFCRQLPGGHIDEILSVFADARSARS